MTLPLLLFQHYGVGVAPVVPFTPVMLQHLSPVAFWRLKGLKRLKIQGWHVAVLFLSKTHPQSSRI